MNRVIYNQHSYLPLLSTLTLLSIGGITSEKNSQCDSNNFADFNNSPTRKRFVTGSDDPMITTYKINDKRNNSMDANRKGLLSENAGATSKKTDGEHEKINVMYAKEIDEIEKTSSRHDGKAPPFPKDIVGIYSHHGLDLTPYYFFLSRNMLDALPKFVAEETKINQDRGLVAHPYGKENRMALFAVYDGHGHDGDRVSEFAMADIKDKLYNHPDFDTDKVKAIHETFLKVEEDLENNLKPTYSGTTACIILLSDTHLYISNLGDSRAVLGRKAVSNNNLNGTTSSTRRYVAMDLTTDQKPDLPSEKRRLEKSGAFVTPSDDIHGPARVWARRSNSKFGLAMSRSLGDVALKKSGVIADPIVTEYELGREDSFMVLATDGIWDFFDSHEVVEMVGGMLDRGLSADDACKMLVRECVSRWTKVDGTYRDDITVIVVKVKDIWKLMNE